MKIKSYIKLIIMLLVIVIPVIVITISLLNSEKIIRSKLLKEIPLGTQMNDVINHINAKKKWKIKWVSNENGFSKKEDNVRKIIGKKAIRTEISEYRDPKFCFVLITNITVFWGFDENSKLIEIWVWKTTDAL